MKCKKALNDVSFKAFLHVSTLHLFLAIILCMKFRREEGNLIAEKCFLSEKQSRILLQKCRDMLDFHIFLLMDIVGFALSVKNLIQSEICHVFC